MASTKKCDICGKLYEVYNDFKDSKNVNGLMFLNVNATQKYWGHTVIDLCPECMLSIQDHIKSLKTSR